MATKVQANKNRNKKVSKLRYEEYYGQQELMDKLYKASAEGKIFDNLIPLIVSKNNILRAYRSIKSNKGSRTAGTDRLSIEDIEQLSADEVVAEINRRMSYYVPKAVRRVEIPKPNGKTRPLGIPCMWDRLIQQCILQILEPICEAKFSNNSYGFRPQRSTENAIAHEMRLINLSKLHYVVEVDIKGFFDNVNHPKLMRQIWTLGIRDKKLLAVIKAILKAPIAMPDGKTVFPDKGTPQGGILSPLLANIVLNEFDHWIDSQWENNPVISKIKPQIRADGRHDKSNAYAVMKNTNLKEIRLIRYADDVRILCRTKTQAEKIMIATKQWLNERLKLEVSDEKTRIVNVKRQYSEFLGFKLRTEKKAHKDVVQSHICDKAAGSIQQNLKKQIELIQHAGTKKELIQGVAKYNAMVRGLHNYYEIATNVFIDFDEISWRLYHTFCTRLRLHLSKDGHMSVKSQDYKRYGKSAQIRYIDGRYILPLAYVQHRNPMCRNSKVNIYTPEGREKVHDNLKISNQWIMDVMYQNPVINRSVEYNDNRLSLFSAQYGKCAVSGKEFLNPNEVHCHHKKPMKEGGNDKYANLILVNKDVHVLIHAKDKITIANYLSRFKFNTEQTQKLNKLRQMAGCEPV